MFEENTIKYTEQPYELTLGGSSSLDFYEKLELITSGVLEKANQDMGQLIDQYRASDDQVGTRGKALLDMLITGVLWNEHSVYQCRFLTFKSSIINILYKLRKNSQLKKNVDRIRGKLAGYWLTKPKRNLPLHNLKNLKRLECYLAATCEYGEELKRIKLLRKFLSGMKSNKGVEALRQITNFAEWFKEHAEKKLSAYTKGLDNFLANHYQNYKGREDYFLTGRRQVEYHLNMLGAEILNRSLRNEFRETKKQVLLLPACMASRKRCQAKKSGNNLL